MKLVKSSDKDKEITEQERLRVVIRGAVQGVGFRPFIYRLASEMALNGWVVNTPHGVLIEVEGSDERLKQFLLSVQSDVPPNAFIQSIEPIFLDPIGYRDFEIRKSEDKGEKTALVLPDISTCKECLREVFDPNNRRYRYPFTNCTHCGPRFSIIEALPYDRQRTTMKRFEMCESCRAEYENPMDRRFHAQPNACPDCGPHLELWDPKGIPIAKGDAALDEAARAIHGGAIVALKGVGGYQLLVDARRRDAVRRLRERKLREEKPFALMFPTLRAIREHCEVSALEERLLQSPESPIVLLKRIHPGASGAGAVSEEVAPRNPYLGAMLPYTPLHHLLMTDLDCPVVATSGNRSEEPICIDDGEALDRLGGVADWFLVHDRPIVRHVDDSVARIVAGRELVLRRARGYAPLPVMIESKAPVVLSVGAHLKNTVALGRGNDVWISQHIGDLETSESFNAFRRVISDLEDLYSIEPGAVACDAHPDYVSTRFAEKLDVNVVRVQHHYAHILSCMAENGIHGSALGVSWDGTGYGMDGTVWGGEFLKITESGFSREACFRVFQLPGGDQAIKEPRRSAVGLLYEMFGEKLFDRDGIKPFESFSSREKGILLAMLQHNIHTPLTSSAGRLFDGVAALLGLHFVTRFEGQAAMALEFCAEGGGTTESYPFEILDEASTKDSSRTNRVIDWSPIVSGILEDLAAGGSAGTIAAKFHNSLVTIIVDVAILVGEERVVLSGGCFQNRYLAEKAIVMLKERGFHPYWHQRVPPNDGGIALGQIAAAARVLSKER
ncbi:MAG: carbamoyltransferase HypF [Candidatus Latescibacteria bacterium]|nr:carbamoyltransferase HypF [Candidatus Latescibacterota bacterium]NIO27214.1 carbamoyltransferase HypF [Candidatus Latescibacterota bacterium]NIO54738.1 carbamoyltransferase HypF [Candidatus Latescibacterota bacterium]NIT00821.1 carbamoyltransferase HypF [Candidatus Latescibacterota bacterium]NIT37744.1 carbamoyltransferase HypF [Candidatus Latescibacterota bacterium]